MGVVQLADDLKQVIDRQVAEGRAGSEAEFLSAAVQRYAEALDSDEDAIVAAADDGISDMEAGRFVSILGPDAMQRLRAELADQLDRDAARQGSGKP